MEKDVVINFINSKNWSRKLCASKQDDIVAIKNYILEHTHMLPINATWKHRAWHIINNDTSIHLCSHCNIQKINFDDKNNKYFRYCSAKCVQNADEVRNLIEAVNIEKYGSKSPASNEEVKQRTKNNNYIKHGVYNTFDRTDVKDKRKTTMLDKYGTEHALQNKELYLKYKISLMENFSAEHPMDIEESTIKAKDTNMKKFGVEYFTQKHIPENSLKLLNDYEWLYTQHITNQRILSDIGDEIGVSDVTVGNYLKHHGINAVRFYTSSPERELSTLLSSNGILYCNNIRNIISPYELDLFLPEYNLGIEYNGIYWHTELHGKDHTYHKNKLVMCNDKGIRLISIMEDEWNNNKELVKNKILSILGKSNSKKVYARKTVINEVDTETKRNFFNANHIQGDGPSSINYGLYDGDELVACIGFIKQSGHYVLNRYATSHNVVGGFTKLLKYFEKQFDMPEIITFADLRWSEGDLYKSTGFQLDSILKPDYKWAKGNKVYHKFNFRHKGMSTKLENYNPELSENANMTNHGFHKLWDCGKLRFVKNKNKHEHI